MTGIWGWIGLVVGVVIPPLVVLLCAAFIIKRQRPGEHWKEIFALNADHGLASQTLFWVALITPVLYFMISGLTIWTDGYHLSINSYGFMKFFEVSKFPIALLSLSVAFTALVTKLHSTAQTAKQIAKNKHDLFYLHRKEFVSYYDLVGETVFPGGLTVKYKINPRVHAKLFDGEPRRGTPELYKNQMRLLVTNLLVAKRCLVKVLSEPPSPSTYIAYLIFCRKVFRLVNFFTIRDFETMLYREDGGVSIHAKRPSRTIGFTTDSSVDGFRCVENYLKSAMGFAGYHEGLDRLPWDRTEFDRLVSESKDKKVIECFAQHLKNLSKRKK